MTEEWKAIEGYPNYRVSNTGRVMRVDKNGMRESTLSMCKNGYYKVTLYNENRQPHPVWVHRLVASAFVENPKPDEYTVVNHIDENPINNNADNLEWCTHAYNRAYGKQFIRDMLREKPVAQYTVDGEYITSYESATKAAKTFGKKLNESHISDCCIGKRPTACGYVWKYKNEKEPLEFSDYQRLAARTINLDLTREQMIHHALFGMCSEVGELHALFQKQYQGHNIDEEHMKKELSDILWFMAEFCSANCWSLNEIAQMNIDKLRARYPDGFDADHSLHRAEGDV